MQKNQPYYPYKLHEVNIPHFKYEDHGVKGVGKYKTPIISMDPYIDHTQDTELHIECCKGLVLSDEMKMGMVFGSLPPSEVKRLNGNDCWTQTLSDLKEKDPFGLHKKALEEIIDVSDKNERLRNIYKYCYFALGSAIPWFFAVYLKDVGFVSKTLDGGSWRENAKHFPKLLNYIKTLPFKTVGRVLFFTTYPTAGVIIHRDSIVAEHKDHNINLFFDGGWRPSFIWNESTSEKIYLEKGARSYFFNNRDYHGVDPEPNFRYTLRIDGTFTDDLCDKLGLVNGYTWRWDYE